MPFGVSKDLVHWQRVGDALPDLPSWAAPDPTNSLTWAPSVVRRPRDYLMYVTIPERSSGRECIAALTSAVPEGPFRDAMIRDQEYLLSLDEARLLHTFRLTAGLPTTAQPLGGWELERVPPVTVGFG